MDNGWRVKWALQLMIDPCLLLRKTSPRTRETRSLLKTEDVYVLNGHTLARVCTNQHSTVGKDEATRLVMIKGHGDDDLREMDGNQEGFRR